MEPANMYQEDTYDGPEISFEVREAARKLFSPQGQNAQDLQPESDPTGGAGGPSFGEQPWQQQQHADGGGSPQPNGLLSPEIERLIGAAWLSGYTQGCAQRPTSRPLSYPSQDTRSAGATSPVAPGVLPPEPSWFPVMHANGLYPCSQPAFYVTSRPRRDQPAKIELLRIWAPPTLPPGSSPQPPYWRVPLPADEPVCATCGRRVNAYTNEDLDWNPVLVG